ncbi:MAG: SGNH/GDSL hydrolase family protein [Draconibacterium sp.]
MFKYQKAGLILLLVFLTFNGVSQENKIKWWSPEHVTSPVIEGQGWFGSEIGIYSRLPQKAKDSVRKQVWSLAQKSAGLSFRFHTNSTQIVVRYKLNGNLNMYHMPTTGVSGLDLYVKDQHENWLWKNGRYLFQDTVVCHFSPINKDNSDMDREYRLYLPLYNMVEWMEIGVDENSTLEVLPVRDKKPIVVYGTSIAQGACASRPGLAWTNILSRKIDRPVINLGFSGNGKLEEEVISLINEIDAQVYILDCLPNMATSKNLSPDEVYSRIVHSVEQLKNEHPDTPVLLVEHAGYSDGSIDARRYDIYTELNNILQKAYISLTRQRVTGLYYLSKKDLGLAIDSYVDGTHPNDIGMMQYANGYEKKLCEILPSCHHSDTLKVMSYNIHYGIGMDKKYDLMRIADVIKKENPDIVGLQEIRDSLMAAELGSLAGMSVVFGPSLGKMDGYGDAVLSKFPFEWVNNFSIPSASKSRYQAMAVDIDLSAKFKEGTKVRFVNTHFDWLKTLGSEEARLAAVDVIEKGFFEGNNLPAVLTGDLNATPGSEPLKKLQTKGWVYESLGKDLKTIGAGEPQKQIDYVLFRSQETWKVVNVNVPDEPIASDHLPIVMTLRLSDSRRLMSQFRNTSPFVLDNERLKFWDKFQIYSDSLESTTFKEYLKQPEAECVNMEDSIPMLYFYREAFDKVLDEVKNTKVEYGSTLVWMLYNMGFVVKTPSGCFGIDIDHRLAEQLEPYLDFLCITHKHGDHYNKNLMTAMSKHGKPVLSNFYEESGEYLSTAPTTYKIGNFSIRTDMADHLANPKFPNFVTVFRIQGGEDSGNFSMLHCGDSGFNPKHFTNVQGAVNLLVLRWGAAMENNILGTGNGQVVPDCAVLSHLIELRHEPYPHGQASITKTLEHLPNVKCENTILPFWGEKLTWKNGELH